MKKVLILGCGWVGEELVVQLLREGYQVWATTTQIEKKERLLQLGIQAAVINFDVESCADTLPKEFDFVLISVPASSRIDALQTQSRFSNVQSFLKSIQFNRNIYLSSIGIYPDQDALFKEEYVGNLNERLNIAEQLMLKLSNTIVYRLGGLFGKNRIFAKYFENKVCSTGNQLTNFVYLDDVVGLIQQGFESELKYTIYNIVAPEHPNKRDVIIASAEKYGFDLPSSWEPKDSFQKIVDGSRILNELDYKCKYPSPLDF